MRSNNSENCSRRLVANTSATFKGGCRILEASVIATLQEKSPHSGRLGGSTTGEGMVSIRNCPDSLTFSKVTAMAFIT